MNSQSFDILMDGVRSINLLAWSEGGDSDFLKLRAIARATDTLLAGKSLTGKALDESLTSSATTQPQVAGEQEPGEFTSLLRSPVLEQRAEASARQQRKKQTEQKRDW